jgi:S1-C subfamily serine protease
MAFLLLAITLALASCGSTTTKLHPTVEQETEAEDPDLALLASVERALVKIVERATPAVVTVTARNVHPTLTTFSDWRSPGDERERPRIIPEVSGSGFIFREDGYIFTSEHVISGAERVEVTLFDGRRFKAKIVGTDHNTDVAVLKIKADEPLPTLKLGDSDKVKVGQFAVAIGNPLNLDFSVTFGIISAKGRSGFRYTYHMFDRTIRYEDYIQTDAWVNKGNSGGPLLNSRGEVIGINLMIRTIQVPGPFLVEGPGFAIPSNLIAAVGEKIIKYGRVIRGWLGIRMREIPREDMARFSKLGEYKVGIRVMEVISGSPAARGGLEPRDIIVEYDGEPIESIKRFRLKVADTPVGQKVQIKVIRKNELKELSVRIGEMPKVYTGQLEPTLLPLERLGIQCSNLSGELRKRFNLERVRDGVLVTRVIPGKPAASAGVKTGMVIVGVEGENVSDLAQLIRTLKKVMESGEREMVRLWVIEEGKRKMIPVEIK